MRPFTCSFLLRSLATLLLSGAVSAMPASGDEPHLHRLYLDSAGFRLEPLRLKEGESRTFIIDRDSELVDVIYTVGPGTSGSVIQRSKGATTVTIRRDQDTYHLTSESAAGRSNTPPPLAIADLGTYRVRLDITAADGRKRAFVIKNGLHVRNEIDGPVMDMFQGMIPLGPGDVSITTRTERIEATTVRPAVSGEAALLYDKGLLFTDVATGAGDPLEFIVDFAAGATVVARSAIPAGIEIQAVEGVEYSARGSRKIHSTMKGAGGDVSGYLGVATLPTLTVGALVFRDVRVSVLSSLPEFGGHQPGGILGMNLLARAEFACVTYPPAGEVGHLRLATESHLMSSETIDVPFTRVGNHLFVQGAVNGTSVDFIFDTGARRAHLHPDVATAAGLVLRPDDDPDGTRGLDGMPMETHLAVADRLRLGEGSLVDVPFVVVDMPVFRTIGLGSNAGLLGNTLLDRFTEVEVDFQHEMIRLVP
jgi:predicted aspartyl protease